MCYLKALLTCLWKEKSGGKANRSARFAGQRALGVTYCYFLRAFFWKVVIICKSGDLLTGCCSWETT